MDTGSERAHASSARAIVGTWLAFCVAMLLAVPQPPNPLHVALGAVIGAVMVVAGFRAASGVRPRPAHAPHRRTALALLSLASGAVVGAALLGVLVVLAAHVPALHARFAGRLSEPSWRPWALAFESSILEEVTFRLFVMSAVAWLTSRVTRQPRAVLAVALVVSTILFGLAHLPSWLSVARSSAALIVSVVALNGVGGVLFGGIFWKWGLPYAMLCHFAGDVVVQSLGPRLLG